MAGEFCGHMRAPNAAPAVGEWPSRALTRILVIVVAVAHFTLDRTCAAADLRRHANEVAEFTFTSAAPHGDPFNDIELDALFTTPAGVRMRVPAFWSGGTTWRVRYASPEVGRHSFTTTCSDPADVGLHGVGGAVEITAYTGDNPLYHHGPIRVAANRRHFEHADGTPFLWLGDTWWMGLCERLRWPADVRTLAADRKQKGFSVIQIVAGLYPDMHPFDPRGANEAGFPWEADYARIRPPYFDAADARLRFLVDEGFSPCIVGAWGYYIPWMGVERAKKHWRYLIARYGAMPVTWCAAGEANLPWYLAKGFPYDDRKQVADWTAVMRYIRATDPFRRPLTIHPTGLGRLSARHATDDSALLDFDMLQTPHGTREAVEPTLRTVRESYADEPFMPVINGEAAYEMLNDTLPAEWTRRMFWLCMTSGAAGHTYGANGVWQVNRRGKPHGPSPHHAPTGAGYGAIPWDEAMHLPGSAQVGHAKRLFERLEWWRFEPQANVARWADAPDAGERVPTWGDWIWHAADGDASHDAPVAKRRFRRSFALPKAKVDRAIIHISADDRFVLWVNGVRAGASDDAADGWRRPKRFDLLPLLRAGANRIEVDAENVAATVPNNPAGLITAGEVRCGDGTRVSLASGAEWQAPDGAPARVAAPYGRPPWGQFGPADHAQPLVSGIAGDTYIIYCAEPRTVSLDGLKGDEWRAESFDPVTGETSPAPSVSGANYSPPPGAAHDWVLVLWRKR